MIFRLEMTILIVIVTSLYFPLNRKLTGGFNLSTRLDTWIPLWPVWVVPYLLCLPLGAAWKMDEELFRSFVSACLFVQVAAMLFFYFFPTYVKRPILTAVNWGARMLQMVYRNGCLPINTILPTRSADWPLPCLDIGLGQISFYKNTFPLRRTRLGHAEVAVNLQRQQYSVY